MEWTEEVIGSLRAFWSEGLPTAEIGRRLGLSKNAVIGKAHRLDLPARPSPIRRPAERPAAAPRRRGGATALPAGTMLGAPTSAQGPHGPTLSRTPAQVPDARMEPPPAAAQPAAAQPAAAQPAAAQPPAAAAPQGEAARGEAARGGARPPARLRSVEVSRPMPRSTRLVACCWPIGDPGTKDFHFCDAAAVTGKPYCAEHAQVAYVKVRDRREEAA